MIDYEKTAGVEQFDREIQRLVEALDKEKDPDLLDAAVVETVRDKTVREMLDPVLADGGYVKAIVAQPAGTVEGIVQFDIETGWREGESHLSPAPVISSIVQVQPPAVIRTGRREGSPSTPTAPMMRPQGAVPAALARIARSASIDELQPQVLERQSIVEFLQRESMQNLLDSLNGAFANSGVYGSTSGTKCTSLFCFERTSDDFDDPVGSTGSFAARGPEDPFG